MNLFDLGDKVSTDYYFDTLQNKLDNCFVKFGDKYSFVRVENGEEELYATAVGGEFGKTTTNINLQRLSECSINFPWPDCGYYDTVGANGESHSTYVGYNTHYTWKAGLPKAMLRVHDDTGLIPSGYPMCTHLQNLKEPKRTIAEAVEVLSKGYVTTVPLNKDMAITSLDMLLVRGWHGSDGTWVIGRVKEGKVVLKEEEKGLDELLDYHGVPYGS